MGEVREGLGEMASPVELGQALAAIGLFARAPAEADLAGELQRLGSTELLRLEMAHWLLGAAGMQVLMAKTAAVDAGTEPVRINRAAGRMLSGAGCEGDDLAKAAFAQVLAKQLEALLMVLVADAAAGRADMPLVIQPALLTAGHLATLLQAATGARPTDGGSYVARLREVAAGLTGAVELISELASKAETSAGSLAPGR
jgi:hypothetical protein